ncbi:MAG: ClpXP protease specificity-enhancing factor [Lautropia sp. SCN 66-9]|nr:MAG: ClpXP protease specificity-enhancing factor [Lautropia sp. SCN 66-9]
MAEISTKPYLIRAIYEWCTDNGYRPYIAVAVDERTIVPREFVRNGEIVLNVSAMATNRLQIGNELVEFEARFGGTPRQVSIPVENISAIFAQENGHGMAFEVPPGNCSPRCTAWGTAGRPSCWRRMPAALLALVPMAPQLMALRPMVAPWQAALAQPRWRVHLPGGGVPSWRRCRRPDRASRRLLRLRLPTRLRLARVPVRRRSRPLPRLLPRLLSPMRQAAPQVRPVDQPHPMVLRRPVARPQRRQHRLRWLPPQPAPRQSLPQRAPARSLPRAVEQVLMLRAPPALRALPATTNRLRLLLVARA